MKNLFNNILIPVDFSNATLSLVNKAVEMARDYSCHIHLLHVRPDHWFPMTRVSGDGVIEESEFPDRNELEFQMTKLVDHIDKLSEGLVEADFSLHHGKWDQRIIEMANQHSCDLVLVDRDGEFGAKKKMLVDPETIAARTDIPVITIPFERRLTHIYSILIPVTNFLPVRKLMYGTYIASRNHAYLKLLGVETAGSTDRTRYFLKKSYQLIHDTSPVYVGMALSKAQNVANAVSALAREESTDLVLVNPKEQTKMPGSFLSLRGKTLEDSTSSPVLIINPL